MGLHWGYVAGILDGEGSVRIANRKTGQVRFEIVFTNTDKGLLEAIQKRVRCGRVYDNKSNKGRFGKKTVWKLVICNRKDIVEVGRYLLPYLFIKRDALRDLMEKARENLKTEPLRRLTVAELNRLYWDKRMSTVAIAKRYGVTQRSVMARLQKFGIPTRRIGTTPQNIDKRYPKGTPEEVRPMTWLSWVGVKFYSIKSFIQEARDLGVSRRVKPDTLKRMSWGDRIYLATLERGIKAPVVFGHFHLEKIRGIRLDEETKERLERETGKRIEVVSSDLSLLVKRGCGYCVDGGLYCTTEASVRELTDYGEVEDPEIRGSLGILPKPYPVLRNLRHFRGYRPFDAEAFHKDLRAWRTSRRPILEDLYYATWKAKAHPRPGGITAGRRSSHERDGKRPDIG